MSALRISRAFQRAKTFHAKALPSTTRQYASSSGVFDAATYAPESRFNSTAVDKMLSKSILNKVPEAEAKSRIELAATYRLFGQQGWNENIYNHLTAKVVEPDGTENFLINAFGLHYNEITASSLIKISIDGDVINPGSTDGVFGVNEAGALHRARPDVNAVMHSHYPPAAGISCTKQGLLELAQTSHQTGPVAYHDYDGVVVDRDEQKSLIEDIGDKNVMFLRNHGVITAAESIGATWYLMYQLLAASEIQCWASACAIGDKQNLFLPAQKVVQKTFDITRGKQFSGAKYGVKELSAYMRVLDKQDATYRN
ncbi:hypothetical protein LTR17_003080 [Elasticomyces elasticus]|nr:hypothetical protein LTR17_003080 [Elasticomyces elasticus]